MPRKSKNNKVDLILIDPERSTELTLSNGWHYSYDTDAESDESRKWVGPFESDEAAAAAAGTTLSEGVAAATEEALFGDEADLSSLADEFDGEDE